MFDAISKDRIISIFKSEFKKRGIPVPIEQCDICDEILYCDNNVYVSDDETKILCPGCMDEEVDRR